MQRHNRGASTAIRRRFHDLAIALTVLVAASGAATPALAQTSLAHPTSSSLKAKALQRSDFATCTPKMQALQLCRAGVSSVPESVQTFLGRGWNEISDVDLPSLFTCLDSLKVDSPGLTGATIQSRLAIVASTSTITDTLNLDTRVSGSIPIKSIPVGGTLEGNVFRLSSVHSGVVSIVARTAIVYRQQRIAAVPALSQAALATLTGQGPIGFRDRCGDKYVDTVAPGGEFIAMMTIFSRDTATQSKVAAKLGAIVGGDSSGDKSTTNLDASFKAVNLPAGASVNSGGSFVTSFEGKELQIQIETLQRGGSNRTNPTTVAQVLDLYRTFPGTVRREQDTVPMAFHLQPYTETSNGDQVRGKLFGIGPQASLVTNVLWQTYLNYLTAQEALNFWQQLCGGQPDLCPSYFPYKPDDFQRAMSQVNLTLANIEAAVDQCSRGDSNCTSQSLQQIVPPDQGRSLLASLPRRKQFYTVGAKAFMDAAAQAGALSGGVKLAEPLVEGAGQCLIDQKEGWNVTGQPTAQWRRIWTFRGVTGTTCRFHIFRGGRLASPWDIHSTDFDIPQSGNQIFEKAPSRTDLTLTLKQVSPLVNINPDTQAILKGLILIGPAGDPATEPWRQAIRH